MCRQNYRSRCYVLRTLIYDHDVGLKPESMDYAYASHALKIHASGENAGTGFDFALDGLLLIIALGSGFKSFSRV